MAFQPAAHLEPVHLRHHHVEQHDVDEALYMADRILVLSPRPTRIQARFELDMPHPRRLISTEMDQLRESILRELGLEMPG